MLRAAMIVSVGYLLMGPPVSFAADVDGIRGPTPLTADHPALATPKIALPDERQPRISYASPPTIPHSIVGYRLDAKENQCLSCHGAAVTSDTPGAPMSISHFTNREGKVSASLAPARYFCTQCHVAQAEASPPIGNNYQVFATPLRRYICMECHLPQPEDVPSAAAVSHSNAGLKQ